MKKFIFVLCCMLLVGCGSTKLNGYGVSNLKAINEYPFPIIKGEIQNKSNTSCDVIKIYIDCSSGSLTKKDSIIINSPKKGETSSFEEDLYSFDIDSSVEGYNFTVSKIECYDKYTD